MGGTHHVFPYRLVGLSTHKPTNHPAMYFIAQASLPAWCCGQDAAGAEDVGNVALPRVLKSRGVSWDFTRKIRDFLGGFITTSWVNLHDFHQNLKTWLRFNQEHWGYCRNCTMTIRDIWRIEQWHNDSWPWKLGSWASTCWKNTPYGPMEPNTFFLGVFGVYFFGDLI